MPDWIPDLDLNLGSLEATVYILSFIGLTFPQIAIYLSNEWTEAFAKRLGLTSGRPPPVANRVEALKKLLKGRDLMVAILPSFFALYVTFALDVIRRPTRLIPFVLISILFYGFILAIATASRWFNPEWVEKKLPYWVLTLILIVAPYVASIFFFQPESNSTNSEVSKPTCSGFSVDSFGPNPPDVIQVDSPVIVTGSWEQIDGWDLHAVVISENNSEFRFERVTLDEYKWSTKIYVGNEAGEKAQVVFVLIPSNVSKLINIASLYGKPLENDFDDNKLPAEWEECERQTLQNDNPA